MRRRPSQAFARLAATVSDCGSAKAGGDLGVFGPGMMQKAFEDATVNLVCASVCLSVCLSGFPAY